MSPAPVSDELLVPRASVDELEDGVLLLDADGRVMRVNRVFQSLLSLPDERDLTGADGMALVRTLLVPLIGDAGAAGVSGSRSAGCLLTATAG
ncbi:MAG: hypothetical protein PWR25_80 [Euryarchaeota archaeon]|jgi:PAS domain-containing protein|nr:hypothetical protein [Euryarchaeota archaeon]MDN5339119.1 hypothetical protein [Euryarchaeota archaeon]